MFEKKINKNYLKLAQIIYGGEFYLNLGDYKLKEVSFINSKIKKIPDFVMEKNGFDNYFSYKNDDSGFCANLFENIKNKELIIAYRGTERFGLGENISNFNAVIKDVLTDLDLVAGNFNEHFVDAWKFYKAVKEQNPKRKIKIVGQSLGGALAQVVAAKEYTVNRKKIETFTFNAPGCAHLLEVYDCNTQFNYSFIYNYSVMNDCCGVFGKHIGQTLFIRPLPLKQTDTKNKMEALLYAFLSSHEAIFKYSEETMGKVFRKPKDFNQQEGIALWYFDENNPLKEYKNLSEYLFENPLQAEFKNNEFVQKTETFFKETIIDEFQNSDVAVAIKTLTDNIKQMQTEQREKFLDGLGHNTFTIIVKTFDSIMAEISIENYKKAKQIVRKFVKN